MKEVISTPTAAALMESTRSIGYSFESALSDIVDNSISAHAKNIWIHSVPDDDPIVSVLDDGDGLFLDDLQEAMRYGTNPNMIRSNDDLGRFGLGMKMASLSQCRCLTVVSLTKKGYAACRWDLDRVIETNQWTLQILSTDELNGLSQIGALCKLDHGTLVVWEKLDKIKERAISIQDTMTKLLETSKQHLRLVFHRFMDSKTSSLNIFLNNSKLEPLDPFLSNNPLTATMPEQAIEIQGEVVLVKPFILPPESKMKPADIEKIGGIQRTLQGFWVYRNKRLIIPGTWFRLTRSKELSKLARVRVDIPNTLDFVWDIDVKKSTATLPAQFQKEFEHVLDKVINKSESKYKFRGRKDSDSDKQFIWDKVAYSGAYTYVVNREHLLIKNTISGMDDEAKTAFIGLVELIEQSVPYDDIFKTMGEAKLAHADVSEEEQNQMVRNGIELLEAGVSISMICNAEPFLKNSEVIKILREYDATKRN